MIIPTAEFDPTFAQDGVPFAEKMCRYIEREFADLLGGKRADTWVRQPAPAEPRSIPFAVARQRERDAA